MKKIIFIALLSFFCNLLHAETLKGYYTFELINVDKNGVTLNDGIKMINTETDFPQATYKEGDIQFTLALAATHLNLVVKNNGSKSIKIEWDNCAYINGLNQTFRIFHSGVRIVDRDKEQTPSPVIKNSMHLDLIIPTVNVRYSDYFHRWMYMYLFDNKTGTQDGDTFKTLISINDNDESQEYLFTFQLKYHAKKVKIAFTASDLVNYISVK